MKIQEKEKSFEKQLEDNILEKYNDIKRQIRLRNFENMSFTCLSFLMKILRNKKSLSIGSFLLVVAALIKNR